MKWMIGLFVFAATACAGDMNAVEEKAESNPSVKKPDAAPGLPYRIEGVLTKEGVICPAMRGLDGQLYVFENLPEGLMPGDTILVRVQRNHSPSASYCDQGQVLPWRSIKHKKSGKVYKADT